MARTHAREHRALPRRHRVRTAATPAPRPDRPRALAIGQQLGDRYRITGFLGRGGMGAVYRAFDRVRDEEIALKAVDNDTACLREEVRFAQQVAHRNVCRIYDLEQIDGAHYIKMEYIAGETLWDLLERVDVLPVDEALAITRAIADGLAAAHARGIVHRDLKPTNIMLDGDRVVVVDFGLAQREGASDLSGTPGYMSPEQLAGAAIDARSDLYALGCVAFEMLAGAPPFGAGTIEEQLARRAITPLRDLRALRPETPRAFAAAVTALLADDPAARVGGAALLAHRPRTKKRIALPIMIAALFALGAASLRPHSEPTWEPRVADLPQFEENADEPSFSPDGKTYVFSSDRGHRDRWGIYLGSADAAEPRLISPPDEICVGARWTHDGRALLMSCYVGDERRIVEQPIDGGPSRDRGPGWYADDCGDALAIVVTRSTGAAIVLRDRDGRDTDLVTTPNVGIARCDRSGQHIVYVEGLIGHPGFGGNLGVTDRNGHARSLPAVHDVDGATFTPDGKSIVFSAEHDSSSSLYEVGVDGGEVHELTPHEQYAAAPDVASDGKSLVYDRDRTSIPLFELSAGGATQKTFRFERLAHVLAAPDNRTLVALKVMQHASWIVAVDLDGFGERTLARGEPLFVGRSGDVVYRDNDDPRVLRAIPLAGGASRAIATLPGPVLDAADGTDGVHVVLDLDHREQGWMIATDGQARSEDIAGLVVPAPAGGWRVVQVESNTLEVTLRFVPPGHALTDAAFERTATWGRPAWVNATELAYCDLHACHRVDVTTRRDLETTAIDPPGKRPITVGADGKRWFITSYVGHVTRHVITNFAERPWAP